MHRPNTGQNVVNKKGKTLINYVLDNQFAGNRLVNIKEAGAFFFTRVTDMPKANIFEKLHNGNGNCPN